MFCLNIFVAQVREGPLSEHQNNVFVTLKLGQECLFSWNYLSNNDLQKEPIEHEIVKIRCEIEVIENGSSLLKSYFDHF